MDEVRVLIGDNRYVTLYTMTKIDEMIAGIAVGFLSGSVLPTPSVTYRGTLFTLLGTAGVADIAYVCLKKSDNTYAWLDILTFRFG